MRESAADLVGLALVRWPCRAPDVLALPGVDSATAELAELCAALPTLAMAIPLWELAFAVASPRAFHRAAYLCALSNSRRAPLPPWDIIVQRVTRAAA